jgi:hypothetical protein
MIYRAVPEMPESGRDHGLMTILWDNRIGKDKFQRLSLLQRFFLRAGLAARSPNNYQQ